ncbi:MAG: hypothetical protein OXQ29_27785, partial [Rhodospirillaceae bacterium]|nr:hypothetical protein [Rhodospirillaceae bacterium]
LESGLLRSSFVCPALAAETVGMMSQAGPRFKAQCDDAVLRMFASPMFGQERQAAVGGHDVPVLDPMSAPARPR